MDQLSIMLAIVPMSLQMEKKAEARQIYSAVYAPFNRRLFFMTMGGATITLNSGIFWALLNDN